MSNNEPVDEELLANIYALRLEIAMRRQSRHRELLVQLESLISEVSLPHPYALSGPVFGKLSGTDVFAEGSFGLEADPPEAEFLYRLCSLQSVIDFTDWKADAGGNEPPGRIFNRLETEAGPDPSDWLPLGDYTDGGSLGGYLGITWWTSLSMSPAEVVVAAQRLGLVLKGEYKLLLRCSVEYVRRERLARVPTVLDAFASEIFHTTDDARGPKHGVTISLESLQDLQEGADEFVIGPVDVSQVQVFPVRVTEDMSQACPLWSSNRQRWQLLEGYYGKLLKEQMEA
jgi:hypothetical protein